MMLLNFRSFSVISELQVISFKTFIVYWTTEMCVTAHNGCARLLVPTIRSHKYANEILNGPFSELNLINSLIKMTRISVPTGIIVSYRANNSLDPC